MSVYLDATTLIALGSVDELDLLTAFDRDLVVLDSVSEEVTTDPARTALRQFREARELGASKSVDEAVVERARETLGETERNGDVELIARVLAYDDIGVVSDDQRVRTMARTLGATRSAHFAPRPGVATSRSTLNMNTATAASPVAK